MNCHQGRDLEGKAGRRWEVSQAISWGVEELFQAEGTADTTVLRQGHAQKVQERARRPQWLVGVSKGDRD